MVQEVWYHSFIFDITVGIRLSDMSGNQMAMSSPKSEWSVNKGGQHCGKEHKAGTSSSVVLGQY